MQAVTILRMGILAVFACIIGGISSLAAIGFVELIDLLNNALLISARSRMMVDSGWLVGAATLCVPALGGLLVGWLWTKVPEHRPLGVPDVIASVQTLRGQVPFKSGLVTTSASILSLGCGASVGQYGPLVHMGSTIGAGIARVLRYDADAPAFRLIRSAMTDSRSLGIIGIACGAAAAISTAFNAPIAGLVFSHEVILRHYSIRAFAPVTLSASVGYVNANFIFDQTPLFRINTVALENPAEYAGFVVIGILGALVAVVFMRAILFAGGSAQRLRVPAAVKPMLAGLCVGAVAMWQPEVLGIGKEVLRFATISGAFTLSELALLICLKIVVTAVCIGFGFAGGVFSPSLLIGALFGALVGTSVAAMYPESTSSIAIYAICGMVAVASPVIGAPLTSILIVFELTRNYDLALACMVSVVSANLIGYQLFGRSLFDVQLARRGIDLSRGREKAILENVLLQDHISGLFCSADASQPLHEVKAMLQETGRTEAYIIDGAGTYVGTIKINEILDFGDSGQLNSQSAGDVATREPLVFTRGTTVWDAMEQLDDFVGESIPVVDDENLLVGVVFEATLVKAYVETTNAAREEEYASG